MQLEATAMRVISPGEAKASDTCVLMAVFSTHILNTHIFPHFVSLPFSVICLKTYFHQ